MKKILEKTIIIILITFICFNAIFPQVIYATQEDTITSDEALNLLNNELKNIKTQKFEEYKSLDEETRLEKTKEYFNSLIQQIENQDGEFYNKVLDIIYKVSDEEKNGENQRTKFANQIIYTIEIFIDEEFKMQNGIIVENEETDWGIDLGGILDGILGFLVYPWKAQFIIPGFVSKFVLAEIASVGSDEVQVVTLETILFNKLSLTDVNIFSNATASGQNVSETIQNIRREVASWYYAFRNFAIALSLAVLIYIGIRMAIDNIAEQKAKYKQMLVNWLIGFGLIFLLHYIIIIILNVNTLLVNALTPTETENGIIFMDNLFQHAFGISLTKSWGAIIMYSILEVITFIFLLSYIKRMLMVCFLTIIAPLISVSYAIDKSGNSKSEILNTWLKEFCYNILIQPFHCIIYITFAGTAMNVMYNAEGFAFGEMIFAVACILCIFVGEKMIRTIFGFNKASSVAQKLFAGTMITSAVSNIQRVKKSIPKEQDSPEAPAEMPDGTKTEEVVSPKVKLKSEDKERVEQLPTSEKITQAKPISSTKEQSKIAKVVKIAGKKYLDGVKNATGLTGLEELAKINKKQPSTQEMFKMASERYRESVNTEMTNEQLAKQMEAIMQTPIEELKDGRDIAYKMWIDYAQKGLQAKGKKNSVKELKNIIDKDKKKNKK